MRREIFAYFLPRSARPTIVLSHIFAVFMVVGVAYDVSKPKEEVGKKRIIHPHLIDSMPSIL